MWSSQTTEYDRRTFGVLRMVITALMYVALCVVAYGLYATRVRTVVDTGGDAGPSSSEPPLSGEQ